MTPSLTISWPQRSRDVNAPGSALSAVVNVSVPGNNNPILTFPALNRDSSQVGGYTQTYAAPTSVTKGQYSVTVTFYSQTQGLGSVVGVATEVADLTKSANLGDIAVAGTVASVTIAPKQTILVGNTGDLSYSALDAQGASIAAITGGSAFYNITSGSSFLSVVNGQLHGNGNGLAQVTVTIDGKTSAPQAVGVGSASLSVDSSGGYGPIAVAYQITDFSNNVTSQVQSVGFGATFAVTSAWFYQNTAIAPAGYGDVAFQEWDRNGQAVSTNPTYSFLPADANGTLPLSAKYVPRTMPAGGFVPNYNDDLADVGSITSSGNRMWDHFPLKVYMDTLDSNTQQRILHGFDRWVSATGNAITYSLVHDAASADITVELGNSQPSPGEKGLATLTSESSTTNGVTTTTMTGDISILASVVNEPIQNGVDPLTITAIHEFGHILGIIGSDSTGGHSSVSSDVMYGALNETVDHQITERDINTLENIYPNIFGTSSKARTLRRH